MLFSSLFFSSTPFAFDAHNLPQFLFKLSDFKCYKSATLWSTKHLWTIKGNRVTFKDFFGCSVIVFQVFGGFSFPPFDPPCFGGSHLTHFFIFFNDSTFCGGANSRATIPLRSWTSKEHSPEIRRPLRHYLFGDRPGYPICDGLRGLGFSVFFLKKGMGDK